MQIDRSHAVTDDEFELFKHFEKLVDAVAVALGITNGDDEAILPRISALTSGRDRVLALAYASDDGSEYEHDHGIGDGHDECPACWAEDIRRALNGDNR
jgi:hypothetical protein